MNDATAARRAALAILRAVGRGAPFDQARDRAVATLDPRDRRLAHELAAGVLRRRAELDRTLDLSRADPRLHDVLRLGAYQLRWLDRVPAHAAVSTSVELAREAAGESASGYVNQALRRLGERPAAPSEPGPTHPEWLQRRWVERYGAQGAADLADWNDAHPPLTLQAARWDQARLASGLMEAGLIVEPAPWDAGLRVGKRGADETLSPREFPGFDEGAFIVQDASAQLVCRYAAIPAGARCYDGCAAPGGKAVTLERRGVRVVAGDARRERLARLRENLTRAGVAIQVLCADLLSAPFPNGSWDAVVVDAPCTATGTMARHPDARWRITPDAIARAATRQRELLRAAAPLVRPGGTLVYATCSLEPEENEATVEEFLTHERTFGRAPVTDAVPGGRALLTPAGDLQTLPHRDRMDGAFAARLERVR
ncbi:MAG TPA: transcription antitermination factor NusB [Gemmatimonadales bacterium]|nr:transcription antitermination factor NusB [Gemmatimonadales bacterium]